MSIFTIVGTNLVGAGLSFEVGPLEEAAASKIVDMANVIHREALATSWPMVDDRFDLHQAVTTLRALAQVVGPIAGEGHRRAADILETMLQAAR